MHKIIISRSIEELHILVTTNALMNRLMAF